MSDGRKEVFKLYTIGDLSRILRVAPWRIRHWARLGLIAPAEVEGRSAQFDYQQASLAKKLWQSLSEGASLRVIRRRLLQLRAWLPATHRRLESSLRLDATGRWFVRLGSRLLDDSGQQHFDFADDCQAIQAFQAADELDELFEAALSCEDAGNLEAAAEAYQRTIALDPLEPVLHFNLGNVLYGLERMSESLASLQEAVRLDPLYAEAWNNLGNVYAELDRSPEAIAAFNRSLQLIPGYDLARANLQRLRQRLQQARTASWRLVHPH